MNILITGGAGFIGTKVIDRIKEHGHAIAIMDNFLPTVHGKTQPQIQPAVKVFTGDVSNGDDWGPVLSSFVPEVVIHLAAETGTGSSLTNPTIHTNTNVHGTAQLIENLLKYKITPRRIILASSRAVYGEGAYEIDGKISYPGARTKENLENGIFDVLNSNGTPAIFMGHEATTVIASPTNIYASTKLAQEHLLQNYCSAFGISLHILRLQNVYGEGQALGNPYTGILVWFMNAALANKTIKIYENGGITRDFVHVRDVAQAIDLSISTDLFSFLGDIGSGGPTLLQDVAKEMLAITKSSSEIEYCFDYRLGDVRKAHAKIDVARKELGYAPQVTLTEGLTSFESWSRAQSDPGS